LLPEPTLYGVRPSRPSLKLDGEIAIDLRDSFAAKIANAFNVDLLHDDARRFIGRRDISGIQPDIVVIHESKRAVSLIENKPYDGSRLTYAQGEGANEYIEFTNWMNSRNIPCDYFILAPQSWMTAKYYDRLFKIQEALLARFGLLRYEDVFAAMEKSSFTYPGINQRWGDYCDTTL